MLKQIILKSRATYGLGVAVLCLALACLGAEAADGAFSVFAGTWKGEGRVYIKTGATEPLKCRSHNIQSDDNINLDLSFVCASTSYRFDFHAQLYTDGKVLRGQWTEASRNASGNVSGEITATVLSANISQPGFEANLTVHSVGPNLDISVTPKGTSVNRVEVTLKH